MKLLARIAAATLAASLVSGMGVTLAEAAPDTARHTARKAAFQPTLKANKTQIMANSALVLSGTVKPVRKGLTVVLQKNVNGKWAKEATLKTNAKGAFRYTDKPKTPSIRRYRVVVPAKGSVGSGSSKAVVVGVYAWKDLTKVAARDSHYTYSYKSSTINGVTYGASFLGKDWDDDGFIDWNVNRKCLRIQGRFGNSDESDDDATATISFTKDGTTVYTKAFALAQSEARAIDISGALRIAFTWTSTKASPPPADQSGASAVLAEPRILCAF